MRQIKFELVDDDTGEGPPLKGIIQIDAGSIMFHFDGYGDAGSPAGEGFPLAVLWNDKELKTYLWPDLKKNEATIVSLEGARERPLEDKVEGDDE